MARVKLEDSKIDAIFDAAQGDGAMEAKGEKVAKQRGKIKPENMSDEQLDTYLKKSSERINSK